jgi:hypothetical protein
VEQNARSGLAAADQGVVLESGRVRLVDSGASLLENPEVGRLYLGAVPSGDASLASLAPSAPTGPDAGEERP